MEGIEKCPLRLISFEISDIMEYCEHVNSTIAPDVQLNFLSLNSKAAKMFKEHFIYKIQVLEEEDSFLVGAKCKAEMKKSVKYDVECKILKCNKVVYARCGCAGGADLATYKHSLALLYAIQSYSSQKLYAAPTEVLQRWHQSKPVKCVPKNFAVANEFLNSPLSNSLNFNALKNISLNAPIFDVVNPLQCSKDELAYNNTNKY